MEYKILFHLDKAPTLIGLSEGGDENAIQRDLLEVEVMIMQVCIQIGKSFGFDTLCYAKTCLELACCEYLKYIKTGECDKNLLPLKPERDRWWPRSISAKYCNWIAFEDDYI